MPGTDQFGFPTLPNMDNSQKDANQTLSENQNNVVNPAFVLPSLTRESKNLIPNKSSASGVFDDIMKTAETLTSKGPSLTELTTKTAQDVPKEYRTGKFPMYYGPETEDFYGKSQGTGEKLLYGVGRGISSGSRAFLQSTVGLVNDIASVSTGGSFTDNNLNKWFDTWQKADDLDMPLYQTKEERDRSGWDPRGWVTGNNVAHFIESLGFMAGMAGGAYVTAGAGEFAIGARVTGSIMAAYDEAIASFSELAAKQAILAGVEDGEVVAKALSQQLMNDVKAIQAEATSGAVKLDKVNKLLNASKADLDAKYAAKLLGAEKIKQTIYGGIGNLGIASSAGFEAKEQFKQNYIDSMRERGFELTPEELQKLEGVSTSVARWTATVTGALGAISFGHAFKGIVAKGEAETAVREEINNLVNKEILTSEEIAANKIAKTATGPHIEGKTEYVDPTQATKKADNFIGKVTQSARRVGKVAGQNIGKIYDPFGAITMAEFSMVSPAIENYFSKQYQTGDADVWADAIGPNLERVFGTKEGIGELISGGLASGFFQVGENIKTSGKRKSATEAAANGMNKTYMGTYLKDLTQSIKVGRAFDEEEKDAIMSGDKKKQYDSRMSKLFAYMLPRVKHGKLEYIKSDIRGYRELLATDEGRKQLRASGELPAEGDLVKQAEELNQHLNKIEVYAENADKTYKALRLNHGSDPRFKDEVFEKLLYASSMIDNASERIVNISKELDTNKDITPQIRTQLVELQKLMSRPLTAEESFELLKNLGESREEIINKLSGRKNISDLRNKIVSNIKGLSINETKQQELIGKMDDMLKLTNSKTGYLKDYQTMILNPEMAHDFSRNSLPGFHEEMPMGKGEGEEGGPEKLTKTIKVKHAGSPFILGSDGKKIFTPSDLEVGEEYIGGVRELYGEYKGEPTKMKNFPKFRLEGEVEKERQTSKGILKEKKILISVPVGENGDRRYMEIDPKVFEKYKLTKLKDLQKNEEAMFYVNHANDVFTYEFQKGNSDAIKDGIITFDKDKNVLAFRYRSNDGKVRDHVIDLQRALEEDRLKFKDSKKEISKEEYDRIKNYRDPNYTMKAARQIEIIDEATKEYRTELEEVKGRIKEREDLLGQLQDTIAGIQEKMKKQGTTKKSLTQYTKELVYMQELHDSLHDDLEPLLARREELQSHSDIVEGLKSNILNHPNGVEFIEYLKKSQENIKAEKEKNDTAIEHLKGLISKAKDFIVTLKDSLLKRIAKFEARYPSETPGRIGEMSQSEANTLLTILRANEYDFPKKQGITYDDSSLWKEEQIGTQNPSRLTEQTRALKEFLETNRDFFKDRDEILKDTNILDVKENEIEANEKAIAELLADNKELEKVFNILDKITKQFEEEYKRWKEDVVLTQAYRESPSAQRVLREMQAAMNANSLPIVPTSLLDKAVRAVLRKIPFFKMKGLQRNPFADSIIVDSTNKNTSFYQQHNNWPDRERDFTANLTKWSFKLNGSKFGLGSAIEPDNVKVMVVNTGNQSAFGFEGFVPESYQSYDKSETIFNKGENRDNSRAQVALVYTYQDESGRTFTIDKDGNLLSEIKPGAEQHDFDNMVFTYLDHSNLKRTGAYRAGESKFYDAESFSQDELNAIQASATSMRKKLLDLNGQLLLDFDVMGGFINKPKELDEEISDGTEGDEEPKKKPVINRSVTEVGLMSDSDLSKPNILAVATDVDPENNKVARVDGELIPTALPFLRLKSGKPVILTTNRFTKEQAENIYNVLKKIANSMFRAYGKSEGSAEEGAVDRLRNVSTGKEISAMWRYLSTISYFRRPEEGETLDRNQFYLDGKGNIVMGKTSWKFDPKTLNDPEVKEKIITIIAGSDKIPGLFHNVDSLSLRERGTEPFEEYIVDDNGNVKEVRTWETLNHWYLSDKYPDGTARNKSENDNNIPVTINANVPSSTGDVAIEGRYIKVRGIGEEYKPKIKEKKTEQTHPSAAPKPKAPEPQSAQGKTEPIEEFSFELNGNKYPITDGKIEIVQDYTTYTIIPKIEGNNIKIENAQWSIKDPKTGEVKTEVFSTALKDGFEQKLKEQYADHLAKQAEANKPAEPVVTTDVPVSDIEARRAEIEIKIQEKLKQLDESDKRSLEAIMPNNPNHPTFKVGMRYNDGMRVIIQNAKPSDNFDGREDSYIAITKIIEPAEYRADGKMTKAAKIETTIFNTKEEADKAIADTYAKIQAQVKEGKRQKDANAKFDTELAALDKEGTSTTEEPQVIPAEPQIETKSGKPETTSNVVESVREKAQRLKDQLNGNPPNTRIVQPGEVAVSDHKGHEEFITWLKDKLPGVKYNELHDVVRITGAKSAWGIAKDHIISVFKDAPLSAKYHEAFHPVFDVFLTDREKANVIREFKNRQGKFFDLGSGKYINFADATVYQIADRLAEEFGIYKTTGKMPEYTPKQQNFFKRLWAALTNIFRTPTTIDSIFKKVDEGGFRNTEPLREIGINNYSTVQGLRNRFTEQEISANVKGIALEIYRNLRLDTGKMLKTLEGKTTFKELIDPIKELFNWRFHLEDSEAKFMENGVFTIHAPDSPFGDVQKDSLTQNWQNVLDNWDDYMSEVKSFLKTKGIDFVKKEISGDLEEGESIKESAGEESNNRDYAGDIFQSDAKNNSPKEIKLIFGFVTEDDYDNDLIAKSNFRLQENPKPKMNAISGMDQMSTDTDYFYVVMKEMANVSGLDEMKNKFLSLAQKIPSLVRPYKAIFGEPTANNQPTAEMLRLQHLFEKTFNKQVVTPFMQKISGKESSATINSDSERDTRQIVNDFLSNMTGLHMNTDIVSMDQHGNYTFNTKVLKDPTHKDFIPNPRNGQFPEQKEQMSLEFLNKIGFNFPKEVFNKLSKQDKEKLTKESMRLYDELYRVTAKGSGALISRSGITTPAVDKIADIYLKAERGFRSTQRFTIDGEPAQRYVLHNNLSQNLSEINQVESREKLLQVKPYYGTDPFCQESLLLKENGMWFAETETKGDTRYTPWKDNSKMQVTVTEGIDSNGKKVANKKMNAVTRFMQAMNMNLSGNFYFVTSADSSQDWGARTGETGKFYIPPSVYNNTKYVGDIFAGYLRAEIETIKDFNVNPEKQKWEQLNKKVGGSKIGEQLRFFKGLLSKDAVKKVEEYANGKGPDAELSTSEFVKKIQSDVNEGLNKYISQQVEDAKKMLQKASIIEKGTQGYRWYGLSERVRDLLSADLENKLGRKERPTGDYKKDRDLRIVYNEKEINDIIKFRTLNHLAHGIEMNKVFFGDPAMYKDPFKRMKLFMSGKDFTHTDKGIGVSNLVLADKYNKVGAHTLKKGQVGYHDFTDTLKIFTYDFGDSPSTKIASANWKELPEAYQSNNSIDGQSHIMLPFYREHKLKEGTWPDDREAQYQYDLALFRREATKRFNAGEKKFEKFAYKNNEDDKALKAEDDKLLAQGNPKVANAFYIDKPLAVGMYQSQSRMVPYALKTSTLPLSWELVRGKALEDKYLMMLESGTAYSGPKSQQKFGIPEGAPELYSKVTGKLALTGEIIKAKQLPVSWSDWGKILETSGEKEKITLGSQGTKLDHLHLFTRGIPNDFMTNLSYKERNDQWSKLSPKAKIEKSEFYKLYDNKNKALSALASHGLEVIKDEIGISKNDAGEYELMDASKLVHFLNQEITRRELPQNMKDALGVYLNPKSGKIELTNALETLANFNQIRSIINSLIDKHINSPKVNGKALILASSAMFEDASKGLRVEKINGKDVLVSDHLEFYRIGKDGKPTRRMQVMMTNFMYNELKKKSKLSDAELMKYLMTEEGKELLYGIGFRIPTQGLNSIDSFEIVPFDLRYDKDGQIDYENSKMFVPNTYGDMMVVPAELTTKAGSDFDVDKLFSYLKNFYIDGKGYPRLVKFLDENNSTPEERYVRYVKDSADKKTKIAISAERTEEDDYEKEQFFGKLKDEVKQARELGVKDIKANIKEQINDIRKQAIEQSDSVFAELREVGKKLYSNLSEEVLTEFKALAAENKTNSVKGPAEITSYFTLSSVLLERSDLDENDRNSLLNMNHLYQKELEQLGYNQEWIDERKKEVIEKYKASKELINAKIGEIRQGEVSAFFEALNKLNKEGEFDLHKKIAEASGIMSFEEFNTKNIFEQNTKEAIENKYQQNIHDIVSHPYNFDKLVEPNSAEELKSFEAKLEETRNSKKSQKEKDLLAEEKARKKSGNVDYLDTIDPIKVSEQRQVMLTAKNQIGIAAQANTGNSLAHSAPEPIVIDSNVPLSSQDLKEIPVDANGNKDYSIKLAHNSVEKDGRKLPTISGGEVNLGKISGLISQIIDGSVDAANDPYLMRVFPSKDAVSTAVMLTRLGCDIGDIVMFLNQPILKELYSKQEALAARRLFDPTYRKSNDTMLQNVKAQFGKGKPVFVDKVLSFDMLSDMIAEYEVNPTLRGKDEYSAYQRLILDEYKKYKLYSDHLFQFQMGTTWDGLDNPSPASVYLKNRILEQTKWGNVFGDGNQILKDSFVKTRKETVEEGAKALEKVYKNTFPYIKSIWDAFSKRTIRIGNDAKRAAMDKANISFIDYLTQITTLPGGKTMNAYIGELFFKDDVFAQEFNKAKRENAKKKGTPEYNMALNMLRLDRQIFSRDSRTLSLREKSKDASIQNILTDSFRELKQSNPALYEKIVLFGHLQSGVTDTKLSFNKFIPHEDYSKALIRGIEQLDGGDKTILEQFTKTNQFYKNNWINDEIVPSVGSYLEGEYRADNVSNSVIVLQKGKYGSENPAVKVMSRLNPTTGKYYTEAEEADLEGKGFRFKQTPKLFRRIETDNEPYTVTDSKGNEYYVFKQINALGDGNNVQEYYTTNEPSKRDLHFKITEDSDDTVIDAVDKRYSGGKVTNEEEDMDDTFESTSTVATPINRELSNIKFEEHPSTNYADRTKINASSDATIALATDFTSAGEKATKNSVEQQGKKYIPIDLNKGLDVTQERVNKLVQMLNESAGKDLFAKKEISLNIAGNGIYTMKGRYTQEQVDDFTYQLLKKAIESPDLKVKISSINTGGQTGLDEAGAKAGLKLGIPTKILAPKGWKFRDINGNDISDEKRFKDRFKMSIPVSTERTTVKPNTKGEYNIYAGTGENVVLSNMTPRKFIYNGGEFNSVEQAFQEAKLQFTKGTEKDIATHKKISEAKSAFEAKKYGREYSTLDAKAWDENSSKFMKMFIKSSFEQNPQALKELLATGDAKLTHNQDAGKWGTEFPKILMEVRDEFKGKTTAEPAVDARAKNNEEGNKPNPAC